MASNDCFLVGEFEPIKELSKQLKAPRGCFGIGSPVSPGCVVSLSKALGDKVATCEIDKGFARGGEGFIIFAEPAVVS